MRRRDLIAALVGAAAAVVLAGGVAWAAIPEGGVIQGCYDGGGNLKVVAALPCPKGFTSLPWNQQGLPGKDGTNGTNGTNGANGVSVTSEAEPAGTNCANGGSKFTAASGVTYACNGVDGPLILVANVDEFGSKHGGTSAGVTVAAVAAGKYAVHFPRSVWQCVRVASLGMATNSLSGPTPGGFVSPGEITTHNLDPGTADPSSIGVVTFDSAGTPAARPFHIAVFC